MIQRPEPKDLFSEWQIIFCSPSVAVGRGAVGLHESLQDSKYVENPWSLVQP
jgi:hypothetical protein